MNKDHIVADQIHLKNGSHYTYEPPTATYEPGNLHVIPIEQEKTVPSILRKD